MAGASMKETEMKPFPHIPWLLATTLLTAASALAEDMRTTLDADGDGWVSASEHDRGTRAMFDRMDADRDGSVTAAEMDAARAARGKPARADGLSSAEKIRTIDRDGDGKLTASEHSAGSKARFTEMDVDHDGSLSRPEWTEGHDKAMKNP